MTSTQFKKAKETILKRLVRDKEKELCCHVRFVLKIGLELAKKYKVDRRIIEISCLLHDVGRDHEMEHEDHGDAGARISSELLDGIGISKKEMITILACIKNHNKNLSFYTLEEKIVITADSASKVLYHEAFMLLCKKQTFQDKCEWGKRYLEKGYVNTLFPEYKKYITDKYRELKSTYALVSATIPI